jgi:hypothetical protein
VHSRWARRPCLLGQGEARPGAAMPKAQSSWRCQAGGP